MRHYLRKGTFGVVLGVGGAFTIVAYDNGNPSGAAIYAALTVVAALAVLLLIDGPPRKSRGFEPHRKPKG